MKTPFKEESHLEKNISKMKTCFWKSEKELILFSKKIKTPFQPLCKENCYSFWSVTKPFIFWKGKHLLKKDPNLKMKALSKNIFNMKTCFCKNWKHPLNHCAKKTATLLGQSSHVIDWNQCIRDLDDDSLLCWVCNNSILVGSRTFNGVETEFCYTFAVAS